MAFSWRRPSQNVAGGNYCGIANLYKATLPGNVEGVMGGVAKVLDKSKNDKIKTKQNRSLVKVDAQKTIIGKIFVQTLNLQNRLLKKKKKKTFKAI